MLASCCLCPLPLARIPSALRFPFLVLALTSLCFCLAFFSFASLVKSSDLLFGFLLPYFEAADFSIINLESPFIENETPIAKMIEKGVSRLGNPLKEIEAAIENVGRIEIYKLEKNLPLLATIATCQY